MKLCMKIIGMNLFLINQNKYHCFHKITAINNHVSNINGLHFNYELLIFLFVLID